MLALLSILLSSVEIHSQRNTAVHKDDLIRLLHLRKDPDVQMHWANTERVMNRYVWFLHVVIIS